MHCQALDDGRPRSICPCCQGEVHGKPYRVVAGHGLRTIEYVCTVCRCEWHDTIPLPDSQWMFLSPSNKK